MRKFALVLLVSSLLVTLMFVQRRSFPAAKAAPGIHQGDLIITGNNVTTIEGRLDINGSVLVEENATLILANAVINFTQTENYQHNITLRNPVNGNPRLQSENSTITSNLGHFMVSLFQNSSATISESAITSYLYLNDYSVASASSSTIGLLAVNGYAVVSLSNSTISQMLYAYGSPNVSVSNSTIDFLILQSFHVNCSFVNIGPRFFPFWDHYLNSSVVVAPGGYAPIVTVGNTTINSWQLQLQGKSNATIADSTLSRLLSYDYSTVWFTNSTASLIQLYLEGRVYVSWHLDVHVIDSIGQDVPSANVTATYSNATVAESKLTDADGQARLTLTEKVMNATGQYPVGNYTVEATHGPYLNQTTVNMTESKQIILALEGFIIPEFPSLLLLPLFMMATLLTTMLYKKKQSVNS